MSEPSDIEGEDEAEAALLAALTTPAEASMIDALLALSKTGSARDTLNSGMEAALAAKMRSVIGARRRRAA